MVHHPPGYAPMYRAPFEPSAWLFVVVSGPPHIERTSLNLSDPSQIYASADPLDLSYNNIISSFGIASNFGGQRREFA